MNTINTVIFLEEERRSFCIFLSSCSEILTYVKLIFLIDSPIQITLHRSIYSSIKLN